MLFFQIMKHFVLIVLLSATAIFSHGQGFNQALGIRGGYSSGFEYRYYTDDSNSYKLLLSVRDQGVQLHAMKEFHTYDIFDFAYQIVFYYGFGVHGGYAWDVHNYARGSTREISEASAIAGLNVLLGLEYVFDVAPVSAGIEVKPYIDIFGRTNFNFIPYDFAFTIKYLF